MAAMVAAGLAWWRWLQQPVSLEPAWTGTATVLAGDGGDGVRDGDASRAQFSDPFGVAAAGDGTLYVADAGSAHRIRRISVDGRVFTVAGAGAGFLDGPSDRARFNSPSSIAIDAAGNLYVADTGNNAIRRMAPDGTVTTVAGDGTAGFRDGHGADARFNGPIGVAVDGEGRVIVADTYNDRIRRIAVDGTVSTLAGSGIPGASDGPGASALFDTPGGVAVDAAGIIYVADTGNGAVRTISPSGSVETLVWGMYDGPVRPIGIAAGNGEVYVTDDRGRILASGADGIARVIAGSSQGFKDGSGEDARFRQPAGIAFVRPGRLVIADAGNRLVRLVAASSAADVRPPALAFIAPRFDAERFALTPLLWPVAPMEGPHEVAGTLGEARGTEGAERFHAGIDIREEEGTLVLAVRDGTVASPIATGDFGSLSEWLRIGPLAYVHVRVGRERPPRNREEVVLDPQRFVPTYDEFGALVRVRVKRGAHFSSGEPIGSINAFNHVHLNVGWTGEEYNPLEFRLIHFEDTIPPTIARRGLRLFDAVGQPLTRRVRGRVVVSGQVQIVVDAWDQADGNRPERRLGLYEVGYPVLNRDGTPAAGFETIRETLRFDRMSADADAARLVYAQGSGIPFYRGRRTRFLYTVTNTFQHGIAAPGSWDTTVLPPGDYIVRAWARDAAGNAALGNRDLPVTIQAQ
jgi:sugar lactone lactonase YvrE